MPEYVIRTLGGAWPAFHRNRNAEVLMPRDFACEEIDGEDDFRMRYDTIEIAFSSGDAGWHIVIVGTAAAEDVDRLIGAVTNQVADAVGEPCEWIQIQDVL